MEKNKMTKNSKYYNLISNSYNELHGEEQQNKARIILKEIFKKKSSGKLLDIGGGTGIATWLFTPYFDCAIVDPSEKLLEQAPEIIKTEKAIAEKLPFKENTFDVIISLTSLHHANIAQSLKEIKRVAKKDAIIVISFLKKSPKINEIRDLFKKYFNKCREIEEDKDIIFFSC